MEGREKHHKNGSEIDGLYNPLVGDAIGWNRKHWKRINLGETVQFLQVQFWTN